MSSDSSDSNLSQQQTMDLPCRRQGNQGHGDRCQLVL